jgi:hypothetical protein
VAQSGGSRSALTKLMLSYGMNPLNWGVKTSFHQKCAAMKLYTDLLLEEGKKLLAAAREEQDRSSEDVVTYLVCHNTRLAISNFLNSFLKSHGEEYDDSAMDSLLSKCANIDGRFAEVDLAPILCRGDSVKKNDCYCYDAAKVAECLVIGEQLEKMVSSQMPAF